jgi:hypothetical protein
MGTEHLSNINSTVTLTDNSVQSGRSRLRFSNNFEKVRLDYLMTAIVDEIFLSYPACHLIKNDRCFEDHVCPHHQIGNFLSIATADTEKDANRDGHCTVHNY